jgi:FdrA protein
MQLQRGLVGLPNVQDAGVVMATPANKDLLKESDLLPESVQAGSDDLLIVVRADHDGAARDAIAQVDSLLARKRIAVDQAFTPKSLDSAARLAPESDWVLISVPGRYAAQVARQALDLGRHVFLYSDNVAIEDEIALKKRAQSSGRLVMGPDCGTAIVHGVGLGFANRVRRGDVGLVAASGTGLQAVASRVHGLGGGISQAFGTGSHDLSAEVGAITTLQALSYLAHDTATRVIVLLSKPPHPEVAGRVLSAARSSGKPVVVYFLGHPPPARRLGDLHFASSLAEAASLALEAPDHAGPRPATARPPAAGARFVRGLFSGGTLATEALQALQVLLHPLYSNVPLRESQRLTDPLHSQAHTLLDLGADQFTVGRLHPMIDNDLRLRRLRQESEDSEAGVILLDLVLGMAAHPDPASELAPALAEIRLRRPDLALGVLLVGTDEDPQDLDRQRWLLSEAGAEVFTTTSDLAEFAATRLPIPVEAPPTLARLDPPLRAINVGLQSFFESLQAQGAEAIHVDWRPPAGGDEALMAILARMGA